ncbi:MAG: CPBP family intramembrane metalloprotease [Candidatus Eisenbacteria bacterium]|nr:CPBP family intramembrane metalloprotease [Candidatus Eisenbacteria bacterium]
MGVVSPARGALTAAAWAVMLAVSDLPDIVVASLGRAAPAWAFWAKAAFLAAFLALTLVWRRVRPLRQYALVLLVLFLALGLTSFLRGTARFQGSFNYAGVPFFTGYAAIMTLDVLVAAAIVAVLWFMKRDRRAFFLARGRLDAPVGPIRWLGIRGGESWRALGWIFGGAAGLAVLVPTVIGIAPTRDMVVRALPLVPAAVLFAAINAFTEETYFRASILSTLHDVIGETQTLLIAAVFFGLAHWLHGSPPGPAGSLMTGFLAWLIGRSMLETRGMLWPWFIHFVPDVVIFVSYALMFAGS